MHTDVKERLCLDCGVALTAKNEALDDMRVYGVWRKGRLGVCRRCDGRYVEMLRNGRPEDVLALEARRRETRRARAVQVSGR